MSASVETSSELSSDSTLPLVSDFTRKIALKSEPFYISSRLDLFDKLKSNYLNEISLKQTVPIKVTMKDGRDFDGEAWKTTPLEIAKLLGSQIHDNAIVAKVNGELFDLTRVIESDCSLEILDFDSEEGQAVFWHSSAHVLGEACELNYGCLLCHGPPTEDGFHYDMKNEISVTQCDFPVITSLASKIVKEKQKFERLEMRKEDLLEMFSYNPYKVHFIKEKIPDDSVSTVYRCGSLVDLCMGPHIPHTGRIKSFQILKSSSSYFLGDAKNDSLQRIYGVSFPDPKMMKEYLKLREEAEKRDHRRLGKDNQLFFFHELSPGSCFFLPYGTRIYNSLLDLVREEYRKRGFSEVITPNIFNVNLWKTSGHWENYQENMFSFEIEKDTYALKPMNCPGHCLIFGHKERSYRELPIRLADFGVLHRNELSGTLTGLTRVRRLQQDDAHIFCRSDQILDEIRGCLDFLDAIYGLFGFQYALKLSTRPEKFLGDIKVWDFAEEQLKEALKIFDKPWEVSPGDGAFYGPKIDITVMDARRRRHQCATIQLDFQMPIRFNLEYRSANHEEGSIHERPVIVHRAILGSLERMIAILTENYAAKWPFWLSPRQIIVIPVSHSADSYADSVVSKLSLAGFYVEVDSSDVTLNKKIRNAEISLINFVFVVGQQEHDNGTINIRKASIDGKDIILTVDEAITRLSEFKRMRSRECFL